MHPLSDPNVIKASWRVGDEVMLHAGEGGKCLHFLQVGSRDCGPGVNVMGEHGPWFRALRTKPALPT